VAKTLHMTLTFKREVYNVKLNQQAKHRREKSCNSKVIG